MQTNFLDLARQGKNQWWRYVLSTALILFLWLGGSVVLTMLMFALTWFDESANIGINPQTGQMTGIDPLLQVTILLLSFLPLLAGLFLAVRFIHARPFISLITPFVRIDWKRVGIGFLVFSLLIELASLVEALLYPGRYQFTFKPLETLKFIPVVLILVPFQAAAEELLIRGYMMQGIGLLTRRAWVPVVASSLVFMLLHFANPEVQVDGLLALGSYLSVALIFALVTVKDNRMELAIGMHIANNVFVLVFNNAVTPLPVPPIFTITTLDTGYALVSSIVIGAIFYTGLHLYQRSQTPTEIA